jgi:hypothetical protein
MRIVSRPTCGTNFRFTASLSRTLQRALPSGGWLHTMAMIRWLWPASSTRGLPGRALSYNAGSSPSSSHRRAMARTVLAATPAHSRKGKFTVHAGTMRKRLRRGLNEIAQWCQAHRHEPVDQQQKTLNAKLRGHNQYYGRPTNYRGILKFYRGVRPIRGFTNSSLILLFQAFPNAIGACPSIQP